jgi:hypothetical protein
MDLIFTIPEMAGIRAGELLRIKLHDKHAALVTLAKTLGMLRGDGVNVTINLDNEHELEQFTIEELRQLLSMGVKP